MTTKPRYKSDAFAAIQASAAALQKVGAIDQTTMRQFDETCLSVPTSQPVCARYLNTSDSTVDTSTAAQPAQQT